MNIALIGYGKMGKSIEKLLRERGHSVVMIVDEESAQLLTKENLKRAEVEVVIDFSTPKTAFNSIKTALEADVAVVSGTTGWLDRREEIETICRERKGAFFYASNFSVGMNMVFRLNAMLAKMMNHYPEYDVTVEEAHHTEKKDAPAGTAITIAEQITKSLERKSRWVSGTTTDPNELEVVAIRRRGVVGRHSVTYESGTDTIILEHSAKSRDGFAMGAVVAAEFIEHKTGVFSMDDLLERLSEGKY